MENSDEIKEFLNEAIRLELNVSRLYKKFFLTDEDTGFWWKLMIEEKNHASLLRTWKDFFLKMFPPEALPTTIDVLSETNKKISNLIDKEETPSREERFKIALEIEESAGEMHFQKIMEKQSEEKAVKLFQKLNADDKNHAARIRTFMEENGLT